MSGVRDRLNRGCLVEVERLLDGTASSDHCFGIRNLRCIITIVRRAS